MKINLCLFFLLFTLIYGNVFSQEKTKREFMNIPLKKGQNPSAQFDNLVIEPVNLFVQSSPLNDNSPHVQLELKVAQDTDVYSTFLWNYETDSVPRVNYPKAFKNYVLSLRKDQETSNIDLFIEKLDFEKEFYLDLGQKTTIGNLHIFFKSAFNEWTVDHKGQFEDAYTTCELKLSEAEEETSFRFSSPNRYEEYRDVLEWKIYRIGVLDISEDILKLKVSKE